MAWGRGYPEIHMAIATSPFVLLHLLLLFSLPLHSFRENVGEKNDCGAAPGKKVLPERYPLSCISYIYININTYVLYIHMSFIYIYIHIHMYISTIST